MGGGRLFHIRRNFFTVFRKSNFFLQSVESIQSLLYDLVNTWLSGCKMFCLLRYCYADFFSVIQVFSAVICDLLPGVSAPGHIPNPFESVHSGF